MIYHLKTTMSGKTWHLENFQLFSQLKLTWHIGERTRMNVWIHEWYQFRWCGFEEDGYSEHGSLGTWLLRTWLIGTWILLNMVTTKLLGTLLHRYGCVQRWWLQQLQTWLLGTWLLRTWLIGTWIPLNMVTTKLLGTLLHQHGCAQHWWSQMCNNISSSSFSANSLSNFFGCHP